MKFSLKKLLPLTPFLIFFVLAAVFYLSIGRNPTLTANALVGKPFPEFQLNELTEEKEVSGSPITLNTILELVPQGQPWLLNVWASWCPQCYMEHGFIEALADSGAAVIGLNYKDEDQKGRGFLTKMGNPYSLIISDPDGNLGLDLGVSGAPETYLIGGDGQILARHAGVIDRMVWNQKFAAAWEKESGSPLFLQGSTTQGAQ